MKSLQGLQQATKKLAEGLLVGRRECLARSITLIESSKREHRRQAELLLEYVAQSTASSGAAESSLRIGIAGPPGAGKSTFIEQLGKLYLAEEHHVAVIPVDPSSHISGGSILGDKTRMEFLSKAVDSYVRASPTRGTLGGIAEHTADVMTLCEAAGFDRVIVESVGLGQSEVDIDGAVDMLVLIVPPGGGDSLQAAKKGIVEAADLIVVNKADGDLKISAQHTKADYSASLQLVRRKYKNWQPKVLLMSAFEVYNIDKVKAQIDAFHQEMIQSNQLQEKRAKQQLKWLHANFRRAVLSSIEKDENVNAALEEAAALLRTGAATPRGAAERIAHCVQYIPPTD